MTTPLADLDYTTITERRQRLREAIAKIAIGIANGDEPRSRAELDAILDLCRDYFLPVEAARVMGWMRP